MIIWLLALVLLGLYAWIGYAQGAVRGAINFAFTSLALLLAGILGKPLQPAMKVFGVYHPIVQAAIAPVAVFLTIYIISKFIAQTVHNKVEIYYQFKVSDFMRIRWQRLMDRLGLCLGLLNGVVIFVVLLAPVYAAGYFTVQLGTGDKDPGSLRFLNRVRKEMASTHLDRLYAGFDPFPKAAYTAGDIAGLVFKNPLLEGRLSRYPTLLTLAEMPEFQTLANDTTFLNLWQGTPSIGEFLKNPKVAALVNNVALVDQIKTMLVPDLEDLKAFLETGRSAKYDSEKILGRWEADLATTSALYKKEKGQPLTRKEVAYLRSRLVPFTEATFVAMPDNRFILKRGANLVTSELPRIMAQGTWSKGSASYRAELDDKRNVTITMVDDNTAMVERDGIKYNFTRETE